MNIEEQRKAFEDYLANEFSDTDKVVWHNGSPVAGIQLMLWKAWLASANRGGYKLVPVEPSKACLDNLGDTIFDNFGTTTTEVDKCAEEAYKAMIGACDDH